MSGTGANRMTPFGISRKVLKDEGIIHRPSTTNPFDEEDEDTDLPLENEGPVPWAYGAV
jgi:hypothetical protein